MNYFDTLETKRNHVKKYHKDKIPSKDSIERALWKAWKTTPGKNNAMPYQVLVWGPDMEIHKEAIHSLVVKSHKNVEAEAVKDSKLPNTITQADDLSKGNFPNPYYEHIAFNPYLFTIHSRVSTPNKWYEKMVEEGHQYDQGYEHLFEHIIDSVAVEVGLFVGNLGYYLLEEGLDISYNSCFRRRPEEWHKVGLNKVTTRPITMISCGYAESYRKDVPNKFTGVPFGEDDWDNKPEIKDIVRWM
jgi:hypothetical protein|tara:strand:+ start:9898 stop:10629 length:732 start_codon:yes stop_codon:yes gene_type:complete